MSTQLKQIVEKWAPVLDFEGAGRISDPYRRQVTALLLENQAQDAESQNQMALEETYSIPNVSADLTGSNSNLARFDPILISLIRRAAPMMIAFDVCGVQPMTGPTGLIFAIKSGYANTSAGYIQEALFNEANTGFSGNAATQDSLASGIYSTSNSFLTSGIGATTAYSETDDNWPQMGFSLTKTTVGVKTRKLKADYTLELAQDLKAVNNLDAEQELSNILSTEILFEMNREIIRNIYNIATPGGTANAGTVNIAANTSGDINGRYFAEQWRGLRFLIERDAIKIQKDTRRGKGNFLICDAETAAALAMIGILDYSLISKDAALSNMPDETTSTYVGNMGKMKVFVDPYINVGTNFYVVGYKGSSPYDAGLFYAPYVPLQKMKVTNPQTFQPSIGFKTRYGIKEHPFSGSSFIDTPSYANAHKNVFYRVANISNLA